MLRTKILFLPSVDDFEKRIYFGKKPHTCESGAHLRISFWHLLMDFEKPEKSEFWKKWKRFAGRYHDFTHVYQKPQSYKVQFLWYGVRQNFFVILGHISARDIIILHLCTTNDDHMMYGSWNIEHNRQNFLSFRAIFCPFIP